MANKKVHEGRNIKRFREMLGIKQDALAWELGEDWNQQKISLLEQRERVDEPILQRIAGALKVPVEALKNFDEEQAVNIIASTFHDSAIANTFRDSAQANFVCTFNPLDRLMEVVEENKQLYERLLQAEREKVSILEKMLGS